MHNVVDKLLKTFRQDIGPEQFYVCLTLILVLFICISLLMFWVKNLFLVGKKIFKKYKTILVNGDNIDSIFAPCTMVTTMLYMTLYIHVF